MFNKTQEYQTERPPGRIGLSSENGAHRIAVEWVENDKLKEAVFILYRDTSPKTWL